MARKPPPPTRRAVQDDKALTTPGPVRDRLLANLRRQGVRDVRLNVIYGRTKAEGYGAYDDAINALRHAGLRPQVTIMGTPEYARSYWDSGLSNVNASPTNLRAFAKEVAGHFKGRVKRYSIWNEPNLNTFLGGAQDNAKQGGRRYRELYRAGYSGVKGVDPRAEVMFGELAPTTGVAEFLRYATAGKKPLRTSGLAFHPYETGKTPVWDITNLAPLQRTLESYKRQGRLQTAKGQTAPLYLTEFGYQRAEMTPVQQRERLQRAFRLAGEARARQLVQYQLLPSVRPTTITPSSVTTDAYGRAFGQPGTSTPKQGWIWDTSIGDAQGNLPSVFKPQPAAGAARARRARMARRR